MDMINVTDQELEQYIRDHGYEVFELTEEELADAREECWIIKNGGAFLDGVLSPLGPVWIRKNKEAKSSSK